MHGSVFPGSEMGSGNCFPDSPLRSVLVYRVFASKKFIRDDPIGIRFWSGGGCIEHISILALNERIAKCGWERPITQEGSGLLDRINLKGDYSQRLWSTTAEHRGCQICFPGEPDFCGKKPTSSTSERSGITSCLAIAPRTSGSMSSTSVRRTPGTGNSL
jgi:hypothetical protein